MDIAELLGRRLRSLRRARGFTQQKLGERSGLSYKFLGGIERGEENPSLRVLDKLATALGVELGELFEVAHEDGSQASLRKTAESLLRSADLRSLQQAIKLLRAILR